MLGQHRQLLDQWEADIHQLTRQYRAEIDTKIVALQLLTAEAVRQSEELQQLVEKAQKFRNQEMPPPVFPPTLPPDSPPKEENRPDTTPITTNITDNITDSFAEIGFSGSLGELEQFSNRMANLDLAIEDPFFETTTFIEPQQQSADEPKLESVVIAKPQPAKPHPELSPAAPHATNRGGQIGKATIIHGLFPEFEEIDKKALKKRPVSMTPSITKPPQLETLLKSSKNQERERIPLHAPTAEIPHTPSPQADSIVNHADAFVSYETEIGVRHDKRHQVLFLAKKGVTAKEIATFNGMPLGEVEMILNSQTPRIYRTGHEG